MKLPVRSEGANDLLAYFIEGSNAAECSQAHFETEEKSDQKNAHAKHT